MIGLSTINNYYLEIRLRLTQELKLGRKTTQNSITKN